MTKEEILDNHLGINAEMGYMPIDRKDILAAMEEYAKQQVNSVDLADVVGQSEQLPYDYSEDIKNCPYCKILPSLCALHDK
jgi:hypothetical protein